MPEPKNMRADWMPGSEWIIPEADDSESSIEPNSAQDSDYEEPGEPESEKPYCPICGIELEWDDTGCWNCANPE